MRGFTLEGRDRDHAVLLLHGLTGAPVEMHPIGKTLHRAGATVHAPLLAGHGGDNQTLLGSRWEDWYASAERAYDELAARHAHVHVAGICLGALLAVALAERRPVSTIAAYGTTFRYDGWAIPRIASFRPLMLALAGLPVIRGIGIAETEPFGLRDETLRAIVVDAQRRANGGAVDCFPLGAVRQLYRLAGHVERIAGRVRTPTLIVHAREDDTSSLANALHLRDRLAGPVRLEILEDSYHLVHLDRESDHVAAMTAAFFELPGMTQRRAAATAAA